MKIKYGNKELLESQTFLALGLGETIVTITHGTESLNFILEFLEDKDKQEEVQVLRVDDKTLKLRLTNWSNPLGTSLPRPFQSSGFTETLAGVRWSKLE